jgi:hypothetical protein
MAEDILEKNVTRMEKYLTEVSEENRKNIEAMLETPFGARFFTAPASSKKDRHGCYEGGLFEHSLSVWMFLLKLNKTLKSEVSDESCFIAGMFHDLGKCGNEDHPFYVVQKDAWRRNNLGQLYIYNEELQDAFTVPQRSLRMLQKFNVSLTDSEYASILYHDSMYVEENRIPAMMYSKDPLVRMIHMADSWSCFMLGV